MATAVASRFAVLSVDVDDDYSKGKKKPQIQKPPESKPQASKSSKSETNLKKKKKPENVQVQPPKPKKKSNNTSKKKKPSQEQWEEWKQKDTQFVEGNYEEELSQAIFLSKIDYEEKKDFYDAMKKSNEENNNKKLNKKNKKTNKAMSLDEFHNSVGSSNSREDSPTVNKKTDRIMEDPEYFDRIKEEIKKEVKKEISKEDLPEKRKIKDSFSQEALTLAQYEDALERRDREIAELKEEIVKLKDDLLNVKTRNKKLCHILANGEMKDKAEVLVEVERLEAVKDELSNEVSSLYAQLEQERSKVRALTGEQKTKDKNKKRTVSSSDTTQ